MGDRTTSLCWGRISNASVTPEFLLKSRQQDSAVENPGRMSCAGVGAGVGMGCRGASQSSGQRESPTRGLVLDRPAGRHTASTGPEPDTDRPKLRGCAHYDQSKCVGPRSCRPVATDRCLRRGATRAYRRVDPRILRYLERSPVRATREKPAQSIDGRVNFQLEAEDPLSPIPPAILNFGSHVRRDRLLPRTRLQ